MSLVTTIKESEQITTKQTHYLINEERVCIHQGKKGVMSLLNSFEDISPWLLTAVATTRHCGTFPAFYYISVNVIVEITVKSPCIDLKHVMFVK